MQLNKRPSGGARRVRHGTPPSPPTFGEHAVVIGERTAEQVKLTVGSACWPQAWSAPRSPAGSWPMGCSTVSIGAAEVREACGSRSARSSAAQHPGRGPPELAGDVLDKGIFPDRRGQPAPRAAGPDRPRGPGRRAPGRGPAGLRGAGGRPHPGGPGRAGAAVHRRAGPALRTGPGAPRAVRQFQGVTMDSEVPVRQRVIAVVGVLRADRPGLRPQLLPAAGGRAQPRPHGGRARPPQGRGLHGSTTPRASSISPRSASTTTSASTRPCSTWPTTTSSCSAGPAVPRHAGLDRRSTSENAEPSWTAPRRRPRWSPCARSATTSSRPRVEVTQVVAGAPAHGKLTGRRQDPGGRRPPRGQHRRRSARRSTGATRPGERVAFKVDRGRSRTSTVAVPLQEVDGQPRGRDPAARRVPRAAGQGVDPDPEQHRRPLGRADVHPVDHRQAHPRGPDRRAAASPGPARSPWTAAVLPVGGVAEKLIAVHRLGVDHLPHPRRQLRRRPGPACRTACAWSRWPRSKDALQFLRDPKVAAAAPALLGGRPGRGPVLGANPGTGRRVGAGSRPAPRRAAPAGQGPAAALAGEPSR